MSLFHQLNTAMRKVIERRKGSERVRQDLEGFENIVTYFKQSGPLPKLREVMRLIQTVPTRFETSVDVATRFIKATIEVHKLKTAANDSASKNT